MPASRIYFDDIECTDFVEGLDTIEYQTALDDKTKTYTTTTTSGLSLTGKAAQYVKERLFDTGCSGADQTIKVKI